MTEQEAIRELHNIRPRGGIIPQKRAEALDVAIKALEEVQAYRAIGTPTQIYEKIGGLDVELGKYASIGTVEEFKALKEKSEPKKANNVERKRDEYGFIYQIGECPCCGKLVTDDRECCDCMQKLEWE